MSESELIAENERLKLKLAIAIDTLQRVERWWTMGNEGFAGLGIGRVLDEIT